MELGVLKSWEFVSQLRRASVIVRRFGSKSGDIFVKGAPEAMREICRPETCEYTQFRVKLTANNVAVPHDYDELLSYYTHKGYRVIGCATKHLPKVSWVKVQKMTRSEAEMNLDFTGFIIFENKLKPTTASTIKELQSSNIRTVMVTGDNILTAVSVARECSLLGRTAHCFVPHFIRGDCYDPNAELQWDSIDNNAVQLNSSTLLVSYSQHGSSANA